MARMSTLRNWVQTADSRVLDMAPMMSLHRLVTYAHVQAADTSMHAMQLP